MTTIWKSDTLMPPISKSYMTKNDYYMKIGDIIETLMSPKLETNCSFFDETDTEQIQKQTFSQHSTISPILHFHMN